MVLSNLTGKPHRRQPFLSKKLIGLSFKIYTKTGDKGSTALIGGRKVSKSDVRIEAYGTVDELNSHIGLCTDVLTDEKTCQMLFTIQHTLFTIGALLATDPEKEVKMELPVLSENLVIQLEEAIDCMEEQLPPLKSFILPGGHQHISFIHIARTVCRRAERCVVLLSGQSPVPPVVKEYLNRLSDYLFVLARYTGMLYKIADIPWQK